SAAIRSRFEIDKSVRTLRRSNVGLVPVDEAIEPEEKAQQCVPFSCERLGGSEKDLTGPIGITEDGQEQ
ncbi:MAG: hypothetical protein ABGY15_01720, partial [bacterium]